jgi:diguanylate cyclase (GGDEF)-like protein
VDDRNLNGGCGAAALDSFLGEDFNTGQSAVMVVDHKGGVLRVNYAAKDLLGLGSGFSRIGRSCHHLICGADGPCEDCLLGSTAASSKSHAIKNKSGRDLFIREELLRFPDVNILVLFDVTREITALRDMDLARKELKAKTVLLERRRHVAAEGKRRIEQMLDQLPDAFVQVDDEYRVVFRNNSVSDILPHGSSETCHGLLGRQMPCTDCPLGQGAAAPGGRKVVHRVEGRCFTEHVIQGSDGDVPLLLFSDTTRQIELIEKIREQQETITRKNDILSNLVNLQTRMQKAMVSDEMINHFLDMFLPLCVVGEALVIVDDIHPGSVWFAVSRGLDPSLETPVVRSYLSREVQRMDAPKVAAACLPWEKTRQVELTGGDGRRVGMIFFPETGGACDEGLVRLFSEPFGAFIHNRLLLRQLEEKANTDPLTGLYNRRYLEGLLAAERKKSDQFDIPYSVVVVDVNRLKEANDLHGHDAGDRLITTVSERLKSGIRATDAIARTGGDEFLILLADTDEEGARELVERFMAEVFKDVSMAVGNGEPFPVTVSLGMAGSDQVSHDALIQTADKRMYETKLEYYRTHKRYR